MLHPAWNVWWWWWWWWWWYWWWLENLCCLPLPGCLHPPGEISFKTDAPSKSRSVSASHEIAPTLHRYLSKSKYIFVVKTFKRSCSRKGPWDGIYYRVLVSPPFKRLFNGPLRSLLGRLCICANVWALFTNKSLFEGLIGKLHCFAANLYKIGFTHFCANFQARNMCSNYVYVFSMPALI